MPFSIGKLSIQKDHVHESFGKRYYVLHGDIFDSITTNLSWLAKLGDIGYTFLLWLNKTYNNRRLKKGLPYYSLSSYIKQKVKRAVSYISSFEEELVKLARHKHCQGVICGHIHHPAIGHCQGVEYLNSGDWVESLTALAEDFRGHWRIIHYSDLLEEEKRNESIAGKEVKKKEKELVAAMV
jgi:UDP-2,3-diacylglucosamine pyrophosphatase LpxH